MIGLNGDESVRQLKGAERPLVTDGDRAYILASLATVDAVVIFSEIRVTRLLELVKPDVYVKGGDYSEASMDKEEQRVLKRIGSQIRFIPFIDGYSTSDLIERIRDPGLRCLATKRMNYSG